MKAMNESGVDCTLVVNPRAGEEPIRTSRILKELIEDSFKDYKKISIGYILHAESKIDDIVALTRKYRTFRFAILHCGFSNGRKLAKGIQERANIKTHIFIKKNMAKRKKSRVKREFITRAELEKLILEQHIKYLKLHKEHEKEIRYIG